MLTNPLALLGLLTLVPLIILYLIRPKPLEAEIPSLLFIRRMMEKEDRYRAFLRRLVRDPLLLIQGLVLIFLTLAMVNPYYVGTAEVKSENVALVIDASGSMQARDVPPSRFERAVELAGAAFRGGDRVSIILAESLPAVALKDGSASEARRLLKALKPKATETNLGDAILLARELLRGKNNTRIVVASDFSFSTTDYEAAGKLAESDGILVNYIPVGGRGSNVGIVGLTRSEEGFTLVIKNYDDEEIKATLDVYLGDALLSSLPIELPPGKSRTVYVSKLPAGVIEFALRARDDLSLDDKAYVVVPQVEALKALLIRENESLYLRHVLNSMKNVNLREARPPALPEFKDYDLVVLDSVDPASLLPGTIDDLRSYVLAGGNLVVIASENTAFIKALEPLLPVVFKEGTAQGGVRRVTVNQLTLELELEGAVTKYLLAEAKPGSIELLASGETPVLAFWQLGEGRVFYYGLRPSATWGNFHLTPSFPIFWFNLVGYVKEEEEATPYRAGDYLTLGEPTLVKTPSAEFKTDRLYLDEVGVYRLDSREVGVSMLSEAESNITSSFFEEREEGMPGRITVERKIESARIFLLLALALIGTEVALLRYRGEF
jgi:hypothetical protein